MCHKTVLNLFRVKTSYNEVGGNKILHSSYLLFPNACTLLRPKMGLWVFNANDYHIQKKNQNDLTCLQPWGSWLYPCDVAVTPVDYRSIRTRDTVRGTVSLLTRDAGSERVRLSASEVIRAVRSLDRGCCQSNYDDGLSHHHPCLSLVATSRSRVANTDRWGSTSGVVMGGANALTWCESPFETDGAIFG